METEKFKDEFIQRLLEENAALMYQMDPPQMQGLGGQASDQETSAQIQGGPDPAQTSVTESCGAAHMDPLAWPLANDTISEGSTLAVLFNNSQGVATLADTDWSWCQFAGHDSTGNPIIQVLDQKFTVTWSDLRVPPPVPPPQHSAEIFLE